MALITELDDYPNSELADETRKLVDLALYNCEVSQNSGIASNEHGFPVIRPLGDGGSEIWRFVRKTRDKVWEKAGLDPSVLRCPEDPNEIRFDGSSSTSNSYTPVSSLGLQNDFWFPQNGEDLSLLGEVTDHLWSHGYGDDFQF